MGVQITRRVQNEDGGGWKEWSEERDKTSAEWVSQWLGLGGGIFGDFLFFFILLWISQNFLKCLHMTFVIRDENKKYNGKGSHFPAGLLSFSPLAGWIMAGSNQPLSLAVGLVEPVCPPPDQWDESGGLLVGGRSRILSKTSRPDKKEEYREKDKDRGGGDLVHCWAMLWNLHLQQPSYNPEGRCCQGGWLRGETARSSVTGWATESN